MTYAMKRKKPRRNATRVSLRFEIPRGFSIRLLTARSVRRAARFPARRQRLRAPLRSPCLFPGGWRPRLLLFADFNLVSGHVRALPAPYGAGDTQASQPRANRGVLALRAGRARRVSQGVASLVRCGRARAAAAAAAAAAASSSSSSAASSQRPRSSSGKKRRYSNKRRKSASRREEEKGQSRRIFFSPRDGPTSTRRVG
ncbi:hypothetical protein PUN28_012823 [Cardiocondyla obscurior]|uniref:Uncharacterized protein n=1 Tax=Cardiocondyla obscurior TaxID=286306 RepID=A0AAW2F558_9HYME